VNHDAQTRRVLALIETTVREILPELAGRALGPADSLEELGANSMDRAEIVMTVLERMNLSMPLVETFGPRNIGELAHLLSAKCS
jgi:polyketide biosynthesis acyl carrier protein